MNIRSILDARWLRAAGDPTARHAYIRDGRRIQWRIEIPDDYTVLAHFVYTEWFERRDAGWQMVKYHYDYFDDLHSGRRGYHCHHLDGVEEVPHAHCEVPIGTAPSPHYRYYVLDLLEAHEEFARICAADEGVSCDDLRPMRHRAQWR